MKVFIISDLEWATILASYSLPDLPYSYDALEPHIDARTMEIHHSKHHQTYVTGLNAAIETLDESLKNKSLEDLLSSIKSIPDSEQGGINFHGGGTNNHSIFWNNMSPTGGGEPGGALADAITSKFGSFSSFKEQFTGVATKLRGSGWTWLTYNPSNQSVELKAMQNQTSPRTEGLMPLLGIDVWEHAYYLKYQNRRPEYISAWWNVVNWSDVDQRLQKAKG